MSYVANYFKRHTVQHGAAVGMLAMPYVLIGVSGILFKYLFDLTNKILAKMDVVLMATSYGKDDDDETYYEGFSDER